MKILSITPTAARVEIPLGILSALQTICRAASTPLLEKDDPAWLVAETLAGAFQACACAVETTERLGVYEREAARTWTVLVAAPILSEGAA